MPETSEQIQPLYLAGVAEIQKLFESTLYILKLAGPGDTTLFAPEANDQN